MTQSRSQNSPMRTLARKLRGLFTPGGKKSAGEARRLNKKACDDRGLLVFEHTGEVIRAERLLREAGLDVEVKGPPPQLRTGCDMSSSEQRMRPCEIWSRLSRIWARL
jgi:Protein of unknown function (DUF3343).